MKSNYTPGPWNIADGISPRVYLINSGRDAVGEIVYSETRRPADARLIAAAPDLLAALEFVAFDGNVEMPAETAAIVQAAINKARGE
jgi:hypothetical protein